MLRLGSHDLLCHMDTAGKVVKSKSCPCCSVVVQETVYHSVGECVLFANAREDCFTFVQSKVPMFAALSQNKKVDFLLSDNNPDSIDASIYRFLYTLFLQRTAKLVEPTGPGKKTSVS
jgi:hypothetical protein